MEELTRELRGMAERDNGDRALSRAGRRARGAYFTPRPLVELVVGEALRAWFTRNPATWRSDGSPELVVLDPAAGDGRFLVAVVDYLVGEACARGHDRRRARAAISARCVVGVERDPDFAASARAVLGEPAVIHVREALLDPPPLPPIDVVVGNPPYQRSIHLAEVDVELWTRLRGRYAATSFGEWDLYAAFIEQALEWLRPGGEVGLVVPSRWLTAAFATRLRAKLAAAGAVRAIVDFGAEQIFPGATTYASLLFMSRSPAAEVVVVRNGAAGWRRGSVATASLAAAPWQLAVGSERELLDRLSAAGPELGAVARIAKGTGTNADPVYVFEDVEVGAGELVEVSSRALAGERVVIERELLRPCLRGRDVRAYAAVDARVQCLVPYDRRGRFIAPDELAGSWPRTAGYLARCREGLEARERGRFRGVEYYRFGRPQNLAFLGDPAAKVVVPDVARRGRGLLDRSGALALDSTYALRILPGVDFSLELVLAVLNSPVVAMWLVANGIPLRGNYLRMKTAYLRTLPLPPPGPISREITAALAVAGEVDGPRLDDMVRRAYGVGESDWGN